MIEGSSLSRMSVSFSLNLSWARKVRVEWKCKVWEGPTYVCKRSKAFECIFFPLYSAISSVYFYIKHKQLSGTLVSIKSSCILKQKTEHLETLKPLTSFDIKISSTSSTSHQLGCLQRLPINPGLMTMYALNRAVSTTCAHCTNCCGVRFESGA